MKNLGETDKRLYQPFKYAFIVFRSMDGAKLYLNAYKTAQ